MPELNLDLLKQRKKVSSKVRPYDFDIPVPKKNNTMLDKVSIVESVMTNVPTSKKISKTMDKQKSKKSEKKLIGSKKENYPQNEITTKPLKKSVYSSDLSQDEIIKFRELSAEKINELDSRSKSEIRLLLKKLSTKDNESMVSYHAQILLGIIKSNTNKNVTGALLSYDDIESFGLRRKYIKKSYEELTTMKIIEVSQVIIQGKIKNKYTIIQAP